MISVIILSWNRKKEILRTLDDLQRQTYKDFEIVVVDQGSTDGTLEAVASYPVRIIRLHQNFGVPGGRNVGAVNAKGDVLVFLDNDASLSDDALERVVALFKDKSIGIVGFQILIESTKMLDLSSWVYQKGKLKDSDKAFYSYTYCGCGHAIRKGLFDTVGYYWDELFFSWEESEYSIRVLDAGHSILYSPDIKVYHRISPENRTFKPEGECLRLKNSLWVLWRYFPVFYAIRHSFVRIGVYFIKGFRQKCFLLMLWYLLKSFSKIGLIFNKEYKISKETFIKYLKLSDKGPVFSQLKHLFAK